MSALIRPSSLSGLTAADRVLFQRFGTGNPAGVPFHRIHDAVLAQARVRPDALAVVHSGESLTYAELERRSAALAAALARLGVRPGHHVGLFLTRSIPMVVGILAVLRAGAAYVPQDIRITPAAQLRHIVATAGIDVVLTTREHAAALPAGLGRVVAVDGEHPDHDAPFVTGGGTAMVIFTSGTTGRPNGVQVTHANLANVLLTAPGSLGIRPGDRVAQLLNIAFDMAAWEILGTLSHGGCLLVRGKDIEETAREADVLIATPGVLSTVDPRACPRVRTVAVAGERCPIALADAWSRRARFHNACGPTEVTIVNTVQRYDPRLGRLTIGRPVPNTTVYVLDDELRPCPIGQVGEMWAGGACVTAGYAGNDVLTAERYRPDPFLGGAHRMFRTRDLVRWTTDGQLEHHGRTDDQVKVRGFRVELDAVTATLERAPGCERATTLLYEGGLVGFVTPSTAEPELIRRSAEAALPYYSVPAMIVPVDHLPLTERGKVDRRALLSRLDSREPAETVA
ncbi:amino acid adenylation domain-containing protein [Amycolatopsis tolypomycina]|uniref:Amino acid adenylation domain-containing protein n=1 Tax=Amycolatopsis tolypomycina TaxID=208445 RepID=A0A1H4Z4R1_9PSEU|nr:amino acid adenylation domain-containing protein [Amycolatopsis tolypomycina]SED24351.1 amino acid adenylation domain-containing protein [Amycolatopsis tolypomycina]